MWSGRGRALYLLIFFPALFSGFSFSHARLLEVLTVNLPLVKSEAIVLVGGAFKERSPTAARLYKEGYAPLIILANDGVFSEWSTKYNRNLYQIEWAEENLVKLGVPREHIVKLPYYGSSTMLDALAVKRYLLKKDLKKLIIVTSDYHTRRALWTFKYVLCGYTDDIRISSTKSLGVGARGLILEYVKYGYYRLRYGIFNMTPALNEVQLKK